MHPKPTLKEKLWKIILEYHNLPYEKSYSYSYESKRYEWFGNYRRTSKHLDILYQGYYYYTEIWKVADCDIDDFASFVSRDYAEHRYWARCSGWDWHPWCPWNKNWTPYPRQLWNEDRRLLRDKDGRKKYQKKTYHEKKVLSDKEKDRKDWKKRKNKKKPRRKCGYYNSPGHSYKCISKKTHRAWERSMIARDKWDDMEFYNSQRRIGCYYDWW